MTSVRSDGRDQDPTPDGLDVEPIDDGAAIRRLGIASGLDDSGRAQEEILGMWGVHDGERLVGGVMLEMYRGLACVNWMAVDAAYRKRGLGRRLVDRLEDEARRAGVRTLWATAREPGFYTRLGYRPVAGGYEHDILLEGCHTCPDYGRICHPMIVTKALEAVQDTASSGKWGDRG